MSYDFLIGAVCDHHILNETLELEGLSPFYTADLRFGSNLNYNEIEVREFYATNNDPEYQFFTDGITDFILFNNGESLRFNNLLFAPGVNFVEGSTFVIPERIYLANYITTTQNCPKCLGTVQQNDVPLDSTGDIVIVEGNSYARQAVEKIILTIRGNNQFQPDYGSALSGSVGQKFTTAIFFKIQQTVQDAVQSLIEIQSQNLDQLTPDQVVLGLNNLAVNQDSVDPRNLVITLTITLGDFTTVKSRFNMKLG
jgi:phage baseplate assembly protein W